MTTPSPPTLNPRKSAVQKRALATIEMLHAATIQVLTHEGLVRCTTTRVAERAGTSVGTLYQYYPNRDALLAAALSAHLDDLAERMERVCVERHRATLASMAYAIVTAVLDGKLQNPEASKALYAVAGERGGAELVQRANMRMVRSISTMLASASDAQFADPAVAAAISLSCVIGNVRGVFEGYTPFGFEPLLKDQLILLLSTYLEKSAEAVTDSCGGGTVAECRIIEAPRPTING